MVVPTPCRIEHPALLLLLADGRLHSGEDLAQQLGVSRAAVWKGVARLRQMGIDVAAHPRRGYMLPSAVELLDEALVRRAIHDGRTTRLRSLDLRFEVDSTNSLMLAAVPPPFGSADVMLTELQHAGRGRRGRHWVMPFGAGLALSLGWSFTDAAKANPALSLCVGVAVVAALQRCGAAGVRLKWPNDLWLDDRKLGGVLLELRAEAAGPAHVVIGVGLNVALRPEQRCRLEHTGLQVACVADACAGAPSRNAVAGAVVDELMRMLLEFETHGFSAFRTAWNELDALRDRRAQLLAGDEMVAGTVRGVDAQGALLLERDGRLQQFVSGEVRLSLIGDGA